ncbi:hypothetical protein EDD86DRAFT_196277 [Gorgonomyces haynaldii]|nr:hypothetical protein EDD86DRAFT_196277 [Gorgonomyces haynaldii]
MSRSFLFDLCDFHLSYLGCSNASSFAATDTVLFVLHILTTIAFFAFILIRYYKEGVRKGKKFKEVKNDLDVVAFLGGFSAIFRSAMLGNLRNVVNLDIPHMSDQDAQVYVRNTIMVEVVQIITGSLAMSAFINTMVKTATGANLFDPIKIGQKTVDPGKALKLFRLFVLLCTITFVCLLGIVGVNGSLQEYLVYKRLYYGFPAVVSMVVSLPLLTVFGSKVMAVLLNKLPSDVATAGDSASGSSPTKKSTNKQATTSEDQKSDTGAKIKQPKVSKSRQGKLLLLRVSIYGVMIMYLFTTLNFSSIIAVTELFQSRHDILLLTKIILGSFYWIYFVWFLFILYPKLF